ncbi:MAG: hypothetical protein Q9186_006493 [Xanthomendoza sp. 1 TL-2023]
METTRKNPTRSRPMKVLFMGVGRTGTKALAAALKDCGYVPYDFSDREFCGHMPAWDRAMRAKFYGEGKPIDKEELDRLTGDFDCVLDMPCCFFAEELCAAYPDAKVVLNSRDANSWIKSANATVFEVQRWPSWHLLRYTAPAAFGPKWQHTLLIWKIFCDNDINDLEKCKRRFLEHDEHVRQVVPKDRLLEYRIQEGWEPLAKFLGIQGRSGKISFTNEQLEFVQGETIIWKECVRSSLKNVISITVLFGGILGFTSYLLTS